ncbi:MAG TPA: bifunctional lysylphosphatidylglycerol flippase/synthetase MprF [Pirellulaceae bacterium]|nr:bifunctional lysylphosphatidylglycerol flippase/synthetase MprF [Pirellulaceae bacterium]
MTRSDEGNGSWLARLRPWLGPLVAVVVFAAAIVLLRQELKHHSWRQIMREVGAVPPQRIALAIGLTALNYVVLSGYDALAVRYVKHPLRPTQILLGSFVGYAMSHNLGWMLGGTTSRYRLYSTWGFSAVEIIKLFAILGLTFWSGYCFLAGVVFLLDPLPMPPQLHLPLASTFWLGPILLGMLAVYLVACAIGRPIVIRGWRIELPALTLALGQIAVASCDLLLASAVMYVLLPAGMAISYWRFANVVLLALASAIISHVPGGVGVLELVVVKLVAPDDPAALVGGLLAFRAIYYLLPLMTALGLLGGHELIVHREQAHGLVTRLGQFFPHIAPRLLAFACFIAGVVLLLSGVTPGEDSRLDWLERFLPLGVLEASHFLGSVVGVVLLLLARGLQRRLDSAYWLAIVLLAAGIAASLLKGFDFEEAVYLALMLAALLPCRRHFYRKSSLLSERFSPQWTVAVLLVLVCALGLALFAFERVEYSNELWWKFAFTASAPRTLRALAGVGIAVFSIALARLLRAKPKPPAAPTPAELVEATQLARRSPRTYAQLVGLGDKSLLFSEDRQGFLMFAEEGRSWVVLGDPVGPDEVAEELAWEFRELCDAGGRWPVFYQVETERLPVYIELGLSILKLGEEARVPLAGFSLEGRERKSLRHTCTRLEREGCTLEVVEPPLAEPLLNELAAISDDWLRRKNTREKGFSLGFFERGYVRQSAVALVRQSDRVVAFANVLRGGDKEELSVDLMRFADGAPGGAIDYLFAQLMLRGHEESYRWFNLGVAPLAGVEGHSLAPAWNRFAEIVYRHGEHFYNFQGLRDYKDKFDPVWTPKFLACPGGLRLPMILTNLATLISGGPKGLVGK